MPEARAGRLRGEMDSGAAGALSFVSQYRIGHRRYINFVCDYL